MKLIDVIIKILLNHLSHIINLNSSFAKLKYESAEILPINSKNLIFLIMEASPLKSPHVITM